MGIADIPEPGARCDRRSLISSRSSGEWHVIRPYLRASRLLLSVFHGGVYLEKRPFPKFGSEDLLSYIQKQKLTCRGQVTSRVRISAF